MFTNRKQIHYLRGKEEISASVIQMTAYLYKMHSRFSDLFTRIYLSQ